MQISPALRALALAAAALAAIACGGDKTGTADSTGAPTFRVALLTPGPISDKSFSFSSSFFRFGLLATVALQLLCG